MGTMNSLTFYNFKRDDEDHEKVFDEFWSSVPLVEVPSAEFAKYLEKYYKKDLSNEDVFKKLIYTKYLDHPTQPLTGRDIFFEAFRKWSDPENNSKAFYLALLFLTQSEAELFKPAFRKFLFVFDKTEKGEKVYESDEITEIISYEWVCNAVKIALELTSSFCIPYLGLKAKSISEFEAITTQVYDERFREAFFERHFIYYKEAEGETSDLVPMEKIDFEHFCSHKYPFFYNHHNLREAIQEEYAKDVSAREMNIRKTRSYEQFELKNRIAELETLNLMKRKEEKRKIKEDMKKIKFLKLDKHLAKTEVTHTERIPVVEEVAT